MLAKGEEAHARALEFDGPLVVGPSALLPKRHGKAAGGRVAVALAILHPTPALAGLLPVAATELERTQQAQLEPEPVLLERLTDPGEALDIGRGIGQQLARLAALARAVLRPEFVEREDNRAHTLGLGALADLAQRGEVGSAAHAQIDPFVRVLQVLQLLIADQDDRALRRQEPPGTRERQGRLRQRRRFSPEQPPARRQNGQGNTGAREAADKLAARVRGQARGRLRHRAAGLARMPFGNPLAPVGGPCPGGTSENSPAFQRWVLRSSDPKSRRDGRPPA